jgi:hypothetical protein
MRATFTGILPGIQPSRVSKIFRKNEHEQQPVSIATASGGSKKMATILQISVHVTAISSLSGPGNASDVLKTTNANSELLQEFIIDDL